MSKVQYTAWFLFSGVLSNHTLDLKHEGRGEHGETREEGGEYFLLYYISATNKIKALVLHFDTSLLNS